MEINKYFTAIFFDDNKKAYKYRNIKNNEKSLQSFTAFALTKKATQINFYNSATKIFCYKVFLKV
tara:strand:+ start:11313 stop:11507 length:195 start_codon:yes stop_codon:yes gene_type:complete